MVSSKKKVLSAFLSLAMIGSMVAAVPLTASAAETTTTATPGVTYEVQGQTYGWTQGWVSDGSLAGTVGQAKRLEAIKLKLTNAPAGASIIYEVQGQTYGWSQGSKADGDQAGTVGQAKRLEAIKITLKGMPGYAVEYKVQGQTYGWQDWVTAANGTAIADAPLAGTVGQAKRLEAIEIKLVSVAPAIKTVSVVDTNKITVAFNQAVDTTKAKVALKQGLATIYTTTSFSADGTTATLTAPAAIAAGDYSVDVSGITAADLVAPVTVNAAVPSAISVTTSTVAPSATAPVTYKVLNQYGSDMQIASDAPVTAVAYDVTAGVVIPTSSVPGKSQFTLDTSATIVKLGDTIRLILSYKGVTQTANLTVVKASAVASLTLGTVAPKSTETRITAGNTGYVIPVTAVDQYGSAVTLLPTDLGSAVTVVSSDSTVVTIKSIDAKGNITFDAPKAGTATVTVLVNATGYVTTSTITVNAVAAAKSVAINSPTAVVAVGDSVSLPVTATDQYGATTTADGSTVATSDNTIVASATIANGKLTFSPIAKGTVTLTVKDASSNVLGSITIAVQPARYAAYVASVSFPAVYELSSTYAVTADDLKVIDQYGAAFDSSAFTFAITKTDSTATDAFDLSAAPTITAGTAAGTEGITVKATAGGQTTPAYNVTLTAVKTSDITSYALAAVPTIYAGGATDTAHQAKLVLTGKTATGSTVQLIAGKINNATSSDSTVATVATASGTATVTGIAKGTATITVYDANGNVLATTAVTVSDVKPVPASATFDSTKASTTLTVATGALHTSDLSTALTVKDQYGVAFSGTGFWASSDSTIATVDTGVVTAVAKGTATIKYVTSNGIIASITVTVQ